MKRFITTTIVALLMFGVYAQAQNVVNVQPNVLNSLMDAVANAQAGDILVLEKGGYYFNQGRIDINVPLTIKAADGDGVRPLVQQAAKEDGSFSDPDFQLFADANFEGLHFNGIRNSRTSATGRAIRLGAENLKLNIDNCVFERYWLRTIGLNDQDGVVLKHTNNIHLWDGREDRIDNGRFIDCRSSGVDSLIVINNTFVNCNDRIIRHMGGDLQPIKYSKFDHNTFFGNIGYRPPFQFRLINELEFTNNIIANVGLLGTDTVSNRIQEIDYDEPRAICVFTITKADSLNTQLTMLNNNVYTEQRFTDLLALNPDTVQVAPLFNKQWEDRITVEDAIMEEELTFGKSPSLDSLVAEIENYFKGGTAWSNTGFITRTEVLTPEELDMTYDTNSESYTAAADGYPLGDLNWWPELKTKWLNGEVLVGVEEASEIVPTDYSLEQNYPNPFNPSTVIRFNMPVRGFVTLKVYNALSQEVATVVNEFVNAGQKQVTFNASGLSSGMYFYQIKTADFTETKKMMLIK